MRVLLSLLLVIACFTGANAQTEEADAPFGLKWGQTAEQIRAMGVKLTPQKADDGSDQYTAEALPMVIEDIEGIRLNFGFAGKLWKITAISKAFQNDPYGFAAKARYSELADALSQK
jgi:hypothetical protein